MFVRSVQSLSRFSLLLLDEGEYYFEDYEAEYFPAAKDDRTSLHKFVFTSSSLFFFFFNIVLICIFYRKQTGRIMICSKSLLFTPENTKYPVIRFLYDNMVGCGKWNGELLKLLPLNAQLFVVRSEKKIEMKSGNQNHPYRFITGKQEYRFNLKFESLVNFLPKIQNLIRISQLFPEESEIQLRNLIDQREASIEFNPTWLVSLSEKSKIQINGNKITPLVQNPGRIVVTDQRLYFQPLHNSGPKPVERYDLSSIERILTRRHALRHIGLEIFFKNKESIYLSFKSYELFYNIIIIIMGYILI